MDNIFAIILTSISSYIVWILKFNHKDKSNFDTALKLLLKHELKEYHAIFVKRGHISSEELSEFIEIYETYHNLGGNGMGTRLYNDILKLEIRGDDDEIK